MTSYVALLRGIGPFNPNMRNEKLRGVVEGLGFDQVQTVISTGNVLFHSDSADPASLEAILEAAWSEELGFTSTTIIRSREQVQALVDSKPFGKLKHGPTSYLLVTFFKHPPQIDFTFPHRPPGKDWRLVGGSDREIFSVYDTTRATSPDVMSWLEGRFGKEISSRTALTVERILRKM